MADNNEDDSPNCPLHKCIFTGDIRKLSQLLRLHDVSAKDKHGKHRGTTPPPPPTFPIHRPPTTHNIQNKYASINIATLKFPYR